MFSFSKIFITGYLLFLAVDPVSLNCFETLDNLDSQVSAIQPRPPLIPDTDPIVLIAPAHNTATAGDISFQFDTSDVAFASLFIFDTAAPSAQNGYVADLTNCIAGATNLAPSHIWNNISLLLGTSGTTGSAVYQCNPASVLEPFSTTIKVYQAALPAGNYWWFILGYDNYYRVTHSSPVYSFTR